MTNDNPKCPVCLTVQTGAHTCKRAKPLRDKCTIHLKEVCEVCEPFRLVPKPQAVEIRKDCQEGKVYGFNPDYMKKEVEPSVDEIADELLERAFGKVCYCREDYEIMCPACAFKPFLLTALRNERNRK